MPALNGETIMTLTDELGNPWFIIYYFFDPVTKVLRDQTQTTSRGSQTGAIVVDNLTGRPQKINTSRGTFNITRNGDSFTAAQLATQGYTVLADLDGISPEIA